MTKNRDIATQIGRSIAADNLDSTGSFLTTGSQGIIVYGADYTASSDLAAVDSSTLADGSLHYLSKLNEMYIWDDSDGAFYSITLDSAWASAAAYSFQGTVSGYASGGRQYPFVIVDTIDKFPFSSDANATDVGNLTDGRYGTGQSSTTNGYHAGGWTPGVVNTIDKFPFSSDANATDVGDLTQGRYFLTGQSSTVSGYASGGNPGALNTIDKFPFAADANASDVGDLTQASNEAYGQTSPEFGYNTGGRRPTASNIIEKFPFATDANATDVGDLTQGRYGGQGQNSDTNGYIAGGSPVTSNVIEKFPFSSDGNSSDVGDLTQARWRMGGGGQSSTTSGYTSGGYQPGTQSFDTIDKFPFSSDANATDVGNLTQHRFRIAAEQV